MKRYAVKVNGWPWGEVEHEGNVHTLRAQLQEKYPGCEIGLERLDLQALTASGAVKYGNHLHQERISGRFDGYSSDTREAMAITRSRTYRVGRGGGRRRWR